MTIVDMGRGQKRGASRYKKSDTTRRRILDVSASLFSRKGYASTSLRDIAGRAKMKSGSIYYYFASKEEILDAVLKAGILALHDAVKNAVDDLPGGSSPRDRIAAAVHAHLNAVLSKSDYIRANVSELRFAPKAIREQNLKLRQEYGHYWQELLEAARSAKHIRHDADLRLLRLFIIGALNWSADWYKPSKQSIREISETFFDFVYDGVGSDSMRGHRS